MFWCLWGFFNIGGEYWVFIWKFVFVKFDSDDEIEWILISFGKKLWLYVKFLFFLEFEDFIVFRIGFVVLVLVWLVIESIDIFFVFLLMEGIDFLWFLCLVEILFMFLIIRGEYIFFLFLCWNIIVFFLVEKILFMLFK